MLVGVYSDVHLNKNMRTVQTLWNVTSMKSIFHMYDKFDELGVEIAICSGDFLDSPKLEARDVSLVLPVLDNINSRSYPTYLLLGNHEIYDEDSNILEYLKIYENIYPVTDLTEIEDLYFIPYNVNPTELDIPNKIVFTHHDIYGSELASGKTKAFFGIDPDVFKNAKLVMNGHVHLKSKVCPNILNIGSLLTSQQGELKLGDYPSYYTVDTRTGEYTSYDNIYSMVYLTIDESEIGQIESYKYDPAHLVLKIEYSEELPECLIPTVHTSWKKKILSIEGEQGEIVRMNSLDLKNYMIDHIRKDFNVSDSKKEDYITTGVDILS